MKLTEIKLSRVLTHLTDDTTCAIISSYRSENSLEDNKKLFKQLKQDVRDLGLGYVEFISRWVEDGEAFDEESILIPGITFKQAMALGTVYNQASIIFKDTDGIKEICTNDFETYVPGQVVRVYKNSGDILNAETANQIFSKRKGGPASKLKKGSGRSFTLKVEEKLEARPSVFRGPSYFCIFEGNING